MANASRPPAIDLRRALAFAALAMVSFAPASHCDDGRIGEASVGIAASLLPLADEPGQFRLSSVVEVAVEPTADDGSAAPRLLDILVELRDDSGTLRESHRETVALARGAEAGGARGVRLFAEFRVGPGRYQVVATAGEPREARFVSRPLQVAVPESAGGVWIASTPLFAETASNWKTVRASTGDSASQPYPFLDPKGGSFLPAATIATDSEERLRALVFVASSDGQFPFLRAQLEDAAGSLRHLAVAVIGVAPTVAPGIVAAEIELGASGAAGRFRLRLGFGGSDGALASPFSDGPTLLVQLPADDLRVLTAPGDTKAAPEQSLGGGLATEHLRILDRLVRDGFEPAATELVKMSKRAQATSKPWRLRDLRDAQLQAMAQRRVNGETLPAIVALHLRAAERFVEAREVWWTAQERQFLQELLRPAREGGPALQAFAADVLAMAMPEAALEIDSAHPLAILRLVRDLERQRRHGEALDLVNRLLAKQPGHPEARLRKAVVLARSDGRAARDLLAALIKSESSGWVSELAHIELARLEHAAGRQEAAIETLRRGVSRLPAQSLFLQLAFYLEEANRASEASAVINRLPIGRIGERPAARHLYALGGVDELEATRARVELRALEGLRRLRELQVAASGSGER